MSADRGKPLAATSPSGSMPCHVGGKRKKQNDGTENRRPQKLPTSAHWKAWWANVKTFELRTQYISICSARDSQ